MAIEDKVAETLTDYETRLQEAATGREHAKRAGNVIQLFDMNAETFDALDDVLAEPLPRLTDEQRAELANIATSGKQSDALVALRKQVEGILSIAVGEDAVLPLDDETIAHAQELLAKHTQVFAVQESARGRGRRRAADGEATAKPLGRGLPGVIRVTFPDGRVQNTNNGDWGSAMDRLQRGGVGVSDDVYAVWPAMKAHHESGSTSEFSFNVGSDEGNIEVTYTPDA